MGGKALILICASPRISNHSLETAVYRTMGNAHRVCREDKSVYTTTTERKSFGELFWPRRKPFQAGGGYKNPIKTRKTISTTEIFPLWTPFFSAKKSSALEQGGVCFLFARVWPARITKLIPECDRDALLLSHDRCQKRPW